MQTRSLIDDRWLHTQLAKWQHSLALRFNIYNIVLP